MVQPDLNLLISLRPARPHYGSIADMVAVGVTSFGLECRIAASGYSSI